MTSRDGISCGNAHCQFACRAAFDFESGYLQLPLHPESYTNCGVVAPKGVCASTRIRQRLANAVAIFSEECRNLFSKLRDVMKAWFDDFSLRGRSEDSLLEHLQEFSKICLQKRFFLSALKFQYYTRSLKWCSRIITLEGCTRNPLLGWTD